MLLEGKHMYFTDTTILVTQGTCWMKRPPPPRPTYAVWKVLRVLGKTRGLDHGMDGEGCDSRTKKAKLDLSVEPGATRAGMSSDSCAGASSEPFG